MKRNRSGRASQARLRLPLYPSIAALVLSVALAASASATTFGTLSNFDVFNDTGQDCHGFEIELDGVTSADISYTFGAPYERYGNPKLVDFPGGVYVRYESPYDPVNGFTATTPQAPAVITPTDGHACWTGGAPGYLTAGCEHFGLGVNGSPTNTVYRWLVADPGQAGSLTPIGSNVSIPAPTWNVVPQPMAPPVVKAVVPAEPPEAGQQFGDAVWAKVYVTEAPEPVELHHLVTDDPAVPQEAAETETEWAILQSSPGGAGGNDELLNEGQAGANAQAVIRRYEFYAYTGAYDPESHEALCGGNGSCNTPQPGELGNYLGAQMAAVNLVDLPPCATKPDAPVLISPWKAKQLLPRRARLAWSTASCAVGYVAIVRQDARSGPVIERTASQASTFHKTGRLPRGHTYFWNVKACNPIGCSKSKFSTFIVP